MIRRYKTSLRMRLKAASRRARLREQKLCLNGSCHGPATHGVRCERCHETWRRSR